MPKERISHVGNADTLKKNRESDRDGKRFGNASLIVVSQRLDASWGAIHLLNRDRRGAEAIVGERE